MKVYDRMKIFQSEKINTQERLLNEQGIKMIKQKHELKNIIEELKNNQKESNDYKIKFSDIKIKYKSISDQVI